MNVHPLLAVSRLNCPPFNQQIQLLSTPKKKVTIAQGPIKFSSSHMHSNFTDTGTALTMNTQEHELPNATYLIVETMIEINTNNDSRLQAGLEVSEVAALVEVWEPALIFEKVFEGVVNTPGKFIALGEAPIKITARPMISLEDLDQTLTDALEGLDNLSEEDRQRLQLASRWFRRGCDVDNEIDKFLSWFIVLEVYPSIGSADVPGMVRDFIVDNFYSETPKNIVKERIEIGRISGMRAQIVHDGVALSSRHNQEFSKLLEKLEVLARVALRNLAGGVYQGELDKWILEESEKGA